MALDNSLLKALAAQVEAIVAGSSNTSATLRAAAVAATDVAAMLEASARDLDADADPDRERGTAVARVEPGEAVGRSSPTLKLPTPSPTQPNSSHPFTPPPQRPHRPPRSASRRRPSDK